MSHDDSFMIVDEKDWANLSQDSQNWMLYRSTQWICTRIIALEKQSFYHKLYAFAGGMGGGSLTVIGCRYFMGS